MIGELELVLLEIFFEVPNEFVYLQFFERIPVLNALNLFDSDFLLGFSRPIILPR